MPRGSAASKGSSIREILQEWRLRNGDCAMALLRSGEAEFGKAELGKYSGPLIESADCRAGPIAHA